MRKIVFVAAFTAAITASFAFKSVKRDIVNATYFNTVVTWQCNYGSADDDCGNFNTGPQCTAYDPQSDSDQPAYSNFNAADMCERALFHQF